MWHLIAIAIDKHTTEEMHKTNMYTCGRMHKPKRTLAKQTEDRVLKLVKTLMCKELETVCCERLVRLLSTELDSEECAKSGAGKVRSVPKLWVPSKPRLTIAMLDELLTADWAPHMNSYPSIGAKGGISKLLARQLVVDVRRSKGVEWMDACGEFSRIQQYDPRRQANAMSRVAFDLLVYIHARASEIQRAGDMNIVLELHSAGETLRGKEMRGCGVVLCEEGRSVFVRACKLVRDALSPDAELAL